MTTTPTPNTTLAGKRALVTGASGALGSAIARRLAADGASVLLHANARLDTVQALADEIRAAGGTAQALAFDLTDDDACAAACTQLL
ncbi:MAG: beta-ketoacyl-ACP reductase, partial [Pseudomonadota bacterium]